MAYLFQSDMNPVTEVAILAPECTLLGIVHPVQCTKAETFSIMHMLGIFMSTELNACTWDAGTMIYKSANKRARIDEKNEVWDSVQRRIFFPPTISSLTWTKIKKNCLMNTL